jgi:hypothetical protein
MSSAKPALKFHMRIFAESNMLRLAAVRLRSAAHPRQCAFDMLLSGNAGSSDDVGNSAVCGDDVGHPCHGRLRAIGVTELCAQGPFRIAQQWEGQVVLVRKRGLIFDTVFADAADRGPGQPEIAVAIPEQAGFFCSTRRVGLGIKEQHQRTSGNQPVQGKLPGPLRCRVEPLQ